MDCATTTRGPTPCLGLIATPPAAAREPVLGHLPHAIEVPESVPISGNPAPHPVVLPENPKPSSASVSRCLSTSSLPSSDVAQSTRISGRFALSAPIAGHAPCSDQVLVDGAGPDAGDLHRHGVGASGMDDPTRWRRCTPSLACLLGDHLRTASPETNG
jgi:hypothetical protein